MTNAEAMIRIHRALTAMHARSTNRIAVDNNAQHDAQASHELTRIVTALEECDEDLYPNHG